ncbi:MAG TPA: hypothetical protein VGB76_18095 [Pyrinomonadaceae bacterium]
MAASLNFPLSPATPALAELLRAGQINSSSHPLNRRFRQTFAPNSMACNLKFTPHL